MTAARWPLADRPSIQKAGELLDARLAGHPAWVVVIELFLGLGWLRAAVEKIISDTWWSGDKIVAFATENADLTLPWYAPIIEHIIAPTVVIVAFATIVLQLTIAATLLTGYRLPVGLFLAIALNVNIIVAGGTGSGKTTMLRALLYECPASERIITIEDTTELHIGDDEEQHPNVVEMETRQANVEGVGSITMMELTRECLRMSPDRVVIGEVRGAEALYMLKAMSQGNDGSMCTIHAESAHGVADRIRGYCAEGLNNIPMSVIDGFYGTAVDLVIHLQMDPTTKRRLVTSIVEVQRTQDEMIRYNELYTPRPGDFAKPSNRPTPEMMDKLRHAGMVVSPW